MSNPLKKNQQECNSLINKQKVTGAYPKTKKVKNSNPLKPDWEGVLMNQETLLNNFAKIDIEKFEQSYESHKNINTNAKFPELAADSVDLGIIQQMKEKVENVEENEQDDTKLQADGAQDDDNNDDLSQSIPEERGFEVTNSIELLDTKGESDLLIQGVLGITEKLTDIISDLLGITGFRIHHNLIDEMIRLDIDESQTDHFVKCFKAGEAILINNIKTYVVNTYDDLNLSQKTKDDDKINNQSESVASTSQQADQKEKTNEKINGEIGKSYDCKEPIASCNSEPKPSNVSQCANVSKPKSDNDRIDYIIVELKGTSDRKKIKIPHKYKKSMKNTIPIDLLCRMLNEKGCLASFSKKYDISTAFYMDA